MRNKKFLLAVLIVVGIFLFPYCQVVVAWLESDPRGDIQVGPGRLDDDGDTYLVAVHWIKGRYEGTNRIRWVELLLWSHDLYGSPSNDPYHENWMRFYIKRPDEPNRYRGVFGNKYKFANGEWTVRVLIIDWKGNTSWDNGIHNEEGHEDSIHFYINAPGGKTW